MSKLSPEVIRSVQARKYRQSFLDFVEAGWLHATGSDYIPGRHVDVLAKHLERVGRGECSRLLVNIPPNCSKSTIIGVMFPAWVWTFFPEAQFLCFSYSLQLSTRDNQKCRDLIDSEWYRSLFPHVVVSSDTDSKQLFELASGGSRRIAAIGGLSTGLHPDFILVDDPLSRDEAMHPVPRSTVWEWYSQSLSSRGLVRNCAHIVAHQRLHVEDLGGHIIKQHEETVATGDDSPWTIVQLPMRHDPELACADEWRQEPGELLCPQLLDETKVKQLERALGPAGARAQLQQDPRRSDTGMIAVTKIKIIKPTELPRRFDSLVRFWDLAGTDGSGCFSVGLLLGRHDDRFFILDVVRGQWELSETIETMRITAYRDETSYGANTVRLGWEEQAAAAGKFLTSEIQKRLREFRTFSTRPMGSKDTRMEPVAAAISYEEFHAVDAPWLPVLLDELEQFPHGKYSDQGDSLSGAYQSLVTTKNQSSVGMVLPKLSEPNKPQTWGGYGNLGKCQNPHCDRPAFGIGSTKEYCCECCRDAAEWDIAAEKHDSNCALQFTEWWAKHSPVERDRSSSFSSFRFRR